MIKSLYCLAVHLQSLPLILLLQLLFALSQQCQLLLCQGCWSLWVNVWYATRDIDRKLHWLYSLYHSDFLWSRPLLLTHLSSVFSSTAALCLFFILTSVCVSVDLPATLRKSLFQLLVHFLRASCITGRECCIFCGTTGTISSYSSRRLYSFLCLSSILHRWVYLFKKKTAKDLYSLTRLICTRAIWEVWL